MRFLILFPTLLLLLFIQGCSSDPYEVDTSKVNLKLTFINLDSIVNFSNNQKLISSKTEFIKKLQKFQNLAWQMATVMSMQLRVDFCTRGSMILRAA
jgi:hypothetical protein